MNIFHLFSRGTLDNAGRFRLGGGLGLTPRAHRLMALGFALLALAASATDVHAQTVTVGADANCDFDSLQAAVDSVSRGETVNIRLSNAAGGFVAGPILMVDRSVHITGGYSNCSDPTSDHNARSVIRGNGGTLPVVFASGFANPIASQLTLQTVIVENGQAEFGGGVRVSADYAARLSNAIVRNNVAMSHGGGVYLDGSKGASLSIEFGTRIEDNLAGLYGGGIYCTNGEVDFRDGAIDDNEAGAHGGGVLLHACDMSGDFPGTRSISSNEVDRVASGVGDGDLIPGIDGGGVGTDTAGGGGVYAYAGSRMTLGGRTSATVIDNNRILDEHHTGPDRGHGGGLVAHGSGTVVRLTNAHIGNNLSTLGGGAYVYSGASFELRRDVDGCPSTPGYPGCASIYDNTADGFTVGGFTGCVSSDNSWPGQGGALVLRHNATALLDGVYVNENRVIRHDNCVFTNEKRYPIGAAFHVDRGSRLEIVNTLVHRNDGTDEDDIIHVSGTGSTFRAVHSDIVGNSSSVDAVIRTKGTNPRIELYSTIAISPGVPGFSDNGTTGLELLADCLYATDPSDFSSPSGALVTRALSGNDPGFVDGSNSNFRLAAGSIAEDFCDGTKVSQAGFSGYAVYDLDGEGRPVVSTDPDLPWDIGAFESQAGTSTFLADLGVTIDDGGLNYGPGSTMGYTLGLSNGGPLPVTGAGFRLTLGQGIGGNYSVLPLSADWQCQEAGYTVTCHYDALLSVGAAAPEVLIQFQAPSIPTLVSSTITTVPASGMVDPVDGNNSAVETTSIALNSDLAAAVTQEPAFATPGTRAVFGFALDNLGPDVASQPRITFTFDAAQAEDIRVDEAPNSWTCSEPTQLPNTTWTLHCQRSQAAVTRYEFAVSSRLPSPWIASDWTVSARVSSGSQDDEASNDEVTASAPVAQALADLSLSGIGPQTVEIGQFANYRPVLENGGPGVALAPVVHGVFSGGSTDSLFVGGPSGWTCGALGSAPFTEFECLAGDDLQVGEPAEILVQARPDLFSASTMALTVTVVSATDDPVVGPGSNNELVFSNETNAAPRPDELFRDSFE